MKIGIFTDRYLPQTDGITVSVETFRIELEKLGHEVYVFAPKPSLRYSEKSDRVIRFPAVKNIPIEDWLIGLYFPPQAIRNIDRLKLDIIHCQTPTSIGLLGVYYALHHNLPLVSTYHTDMYQYVKHYRQILPGVIMLSLAAPMITGGDMEGYRQALSSIKPERSIDKWNQKLIVRGFTLLHNYCDLVITPSKKFEKQLKSWKTKSLIVTLPTGVDRITSTSREVAEIRKKYNIKPTDKVILLVCRVGTEKNIGLLIKAFDTIGTRVPDARIMVIGPGDDLDYFRKEAADSKYPDRILFTGYVPYRQLGAYYDAATVFAFPSTADTQGLAVNEAACAGLPIVMVDREITQVVINGENGYFSRNTPRDFASKIVNILTNPKLHGQMSKHSLELAKQVSAAEQAQKLLELYQGTIERHRAKATSRKNDK